MYISKACQFLVENRGIILDEKIHFKSQERKQIYTSCLNVFYSNATVLSFSKSEKKFSSGYHYYLLRKGEIKVSLKQKNSLLWLNYCGIFQTWSNACGNQGQRNCSQGNFRKIGFCFFLNYFFVFYEVGIICRTFH